MTASKQTLRNQRYQDKAGWMSKSYKMKRETVEAFADACNKAGVSQAGQLMKMMREFIEEVNRTDNEKREHQARKCLMLFVWIIYKTND